MAQAAPRYHFLDALRGAAMMLGVVYHVGSRFQGEVPFLGLGMWALNGFRMALFFAIAGFFAHLVYMRRGGWGFSRHRLFHIGVPFAIASLILLPISLHRGTIGGVSIALPGLHPLLHAFWRGEIGLAQAADGIQIQHIWFLQYLLIYYAIALVAAGPVRRIAHRLASARFAAAGEALIASPWKPLLLAVPTTALLMVVGSPTVDREAAHLLPAPGILLYYGFFFTAGWLFFDLRHRFSDLPRHRHAYAGVALVLLAIVPSLHPWSPIHASSPIWRAVAFYLTALFGWLAIFAASGTFFVHLNESRPAVRYVADASYWIYLIHSQLMMLLSPLVAALPLPPTAQLLLICGVVFALGFASYQSAVRYTAIGAVLNGRRLRPERPARGIPALRPAGILRLLPNRSGLGRSDLSEELAVSKS
jgi:peptidoglycan/LPS O-acetylase OafA/YrhL